MEVKIWHSMGFPIIGYGEVEYTSGAGETKRWFALGLAARKSYMSLYIWGSVGGQYLLEKYAADLGGIKTGKSCLNFKTLAELNLVTLQEVVRRAGESV